MTREELISKFPITLDVTQEIIETADKEDILDCIGVRTLKQHFTECYVKWGRDIGYIRTEPRAPSVSLRTTVDMMEIKTPMHVTFEIYESY